MEFYEEAKQKLTKEMPVITGPKEGAIKHAVMEALLNFAGQDEEFAQAIVQGGTFKNCMAAVCKGIGNSISDLEAYRRAAAFFFPGAIVRFEMHIELNGEETDCNNNAAAMVHNDGDAGAKGGGLVIDLADFL